MSGTEDTIEELATMEREVLAFALIVGRQLWQYYWGNKPSEQDRAEACADLACAVAIYDVYVQARHPPNVAIVDPLAPTGCPYCKGQGAHAELCEVAAQLRAELAKTAPGG